MTKVSIYHNVNPDAYFGLNVVFAHGAKRPAATAEERHELVLVFTYEHDGKDKFGHPFPSHPATAHYLICEMAFETFNVGTDDLARRYRARRLRSLSVGDVAVIDGAAYECASLGFSPVSESDLRILSAKDADPVIRERFGFPPGERLSVTVPLPDTWACEDCGWPQPPMVPVTAESECDNCGGTMTVVQP